MIRRAWALLLLAVASMPAFADDPKPMPPGETPAVDLERLREAILKDMQSVEKKLKESDPGGDTRSIQSRILENLDKLLDQAKKPPPSGDSSQKSDSPQGGASEPKSGARESSGSGRSRRERREAERQRRQQQQARSGGGQQSAGQPGQRMPMPESAGPAGQPPNFAVPRPGAKAEAMADVVRDIWGHLPESMRQEVERYYRVQFMPRYRDLLEQYYLRLAESERSKKGGRP